jgi:hypothetical protein
MPYSDKSVLICRIRAICVLLISPKILLFLLLQIVSAMKKVIIFSIILTGFLFPMSCSQTPPSKSAQIMDKKKSAIPVQFDLNDLKHRTFNYFWKEADSISGLVEDRAPTKAFCSVASTGFGLSAYIIGVENGYIKRDEAAARVLKLLRFLWQLPQDPAMAGIGGYRGFFYHFLDMRTGYRYKNVELSSIDTGLLMAGILSVMEYFDGDDAVEKEIRSLADALFQRVEWDFFLNDTPALSMGWFPDRGFLEAEWVGYNEAMVLLVMAMGSPTHPIPEICWDKWTATYDWGEYYGYEHLNFGPLFGHQYSHMYIDFRGIQDYYMAGKGLDYFENSRRATYANRAYCMANPMGFKDYSDTIWGLTACDGPGYLEKEINGKKIIFEGYSARGAALVHSRDDGTIAPTAAGGSIPFAPEICLPALKAMYNKYGSKLYGEYGFLDSFNPTFTYGKGNEEGWYDPDYIGIDQGAIICMIENYQTGLIWNLMKKNKYIVAGLKKAGFKGGWLEGM